MTDPTLLTLARHPALRVADFPGKGRGLVAGAPIREGEVLDEAPVLRLRTDELGARTDGIYSYPFDWPEPPYAEAIALGVISLINHSEEPNCWFETDFDKRVMRLHADRDIAAGEEITIHYGIPLWFEAHP